ncbi:MAG TPA: energy transducer TonB [Stellaceae bacterium]|nr:energy transducer TonB [Stellaceae bacterium]
MAISEAFDLLDIVIGEEAPDEPDRFDRLAVALADDPAPFEDRPEPTLAAAPFFVEFDEPARLDPERVGLAWEVPPPAERLIRLRSPLVSLAVHLLPLLLIVLWPNAVEAPPVIPVQLVFEQPPPPPPPPQPAPQPPKPPPPKMEAGRLSSVDMGAVKPNEEGLSTRPFPAFGKPQPTESETDSQQKPTPAPLPAPKPTPPKDEQHAALAPPKPSGAAVPHHDQTPHDAPHVARFAGPAATRDEYLAYLVTLTRQHLDLLPLSMVGGRRGETVLSVIVYDNGVIGPISIVRSSNYPDIDQRIEQMVAAVRRAPPLPQWYQGNAVQLEFTLKFPEALERP